MKEKPRILRNIIELIVGMGFVFGAMTASDNFFSKGFVKFDQPILGKPASDTLTVYKGPDLVRDKLNTVSVDRNSTLRATQGYLGKCYLYPDKDMVYIDGLKWVVKDQMVFSQPDNDRLEATLAEHWERIKDSDPDNYMSSIITLGVIYSLYRQFEKYF